MSYLLNKVGQHIGAACLLVACFTIPYAAGAADKLVALYSAHAIPYAMPWVAEELGLFRKYDVDFDFVYYLAEMESSGFFKQVWAR